MQQLPTFAASENRVFFRKLQYDIIMIILEGALHIFLDSGDYVHTMTSLSPRVGLYVAAAAVTCRRMLASVKND